jgi:hypothetical protein
MTRSIFALAFAVVCCVISLAPQARADEVIVFDGDTYAAIAYSQNTGSVGYAYNCGSRGEAERMALRNCKGSDARIVTWVNNGFCALAVGQDGAWGIGYSWGDGASNTEARARALAECRKRTTGARIRVCICSEDVEPEVH